MGTTRDRLSVGVVAVLLTMGLVAPAAADGADPIPGEDRCFGDEEFEFRRVSTAFFTPGDQPEGYEATGADRVVTEGSEGTPEQGYTETEYERHLVTPPETVTEYEFVHASPKHPDSPRWEAEGWNADGNPNSNGWTSTGEVRERTVTPGTSTTERQYFVEHPGGDWTPTGNTTYVKTADAVPGTDPVLEYEYELVELSGPVSGDEVADYEGWEEIGSTRPVVDCPEPVTIIEVSPIAECLVEELNGDYTAYFGYENHSTIDGAPLSVDSADLRSNDLTPSAASLNVTLPTSFPYPEVVDGRPGRTAFQSPGAFAVTWDGAGDIVWNLDGRSATASSTTTRCDDQPQPPVIGDPEGPVVPTPSAPTPSAPTDPTPTGSLTAEATEVCVAPDRAEMIAFTFSDVSNVSLVTVTLTSPDDASFRRAIVLELADAPFASVAWPLDAAGVPYARVDSTISADGVTDTVVPLELARIAEACTTVLDEDPLEQDGPEKDTTDEDTTDEDTTGGETTGGETTGGETTGGETTGGEAVSRDRAGSDRTGGETTGGDRTGRDTRVLGVIHRTPGSASTTGTASTGAHTASIQAERLPRTGVPLLALVVMGLASIGLGTGALRRGRS